MTESGGAGLRQQLGVGRQPSGKEGAAGTALDHRHGDPCRGLEGQLGRAPGEGSLEVSSGLRNERPFAHLDGPRGPFKGPRGPLKGPRGALKGPRGPLKGAKAGKPGPRGPVKGVWGPRELVKGPLGRFKGTRPGCLLKAPGCL